MILDRLTLATIISEEVGDSIAMRECKKAADRIMELTLSKQKELLDAAQAWKKKAEAAIADHAVKTEQHVAAVTKLSEVSKLKDEAEARVGELLKSITHINERADNATKIAATAENKKKELLSMMQDFQHRLEQSSEFKTAIHFLDKGEEIATLTDVIPDEYNYG